MMAATITLPGNGLVAEVERHGRGAPLVYLHGAFGLEWSAPLVDALARSHEVIAPKLPGYGASEGLERIRSFHDLSVWLDEVLDALGLERVALAGHDFGGAAAAEYAALFRRRVERLVLLAPYGLWQDEAPLEDIFGLTPGALTKLLYADPGGEAATAFNAPLPDPVAQTESILRRRQALIAAAKLMWPIPDKGLKHRLYRVTAPTLVVGGTQDALMGRGYLDAFAAAMPDARVRMVRSGHMIPQEAAAETAAAIDDFAGARPA
jgi:pimeloyl-ACP methyl ester carboxylesterase